MRRLHLYLTKRLRALKSYLQNLCIWQRADRRDHHRQTAPPQASTHTRHVSNFARLGVEFCRAAPLATLRHLLAPLRPTLLRATVPLLIVGVILAFSGYPEPSYATICGTGSNITFTDIGGGQCRAFITTTGSSTFTVPSDWNSTNNTIEAIGAGGNGDSSGGGGGGGAYDKITYWAGSGSISVQVGIHGGTTGSGTSPTANTWFQNGTTLVAAGGAAGTSGAGGTTANSYPSASAFAGGAGGGAPSAGGGGGGGAAGPHGAGANGTSGGSSTGGPGGIGDNGSGGSGGLNANPTGHNGSNGTEWDATHGSGGGGGGSDNGNGGGNGGTYGAGGGGYASNGGNGIIVITYAPVQSTSSRIIRLRGGVRLLGGVVLGGSTYPTFAIALSPTSLPDGTNGSAYSQTISASGGDNPYTYSITSGSLPSGLSLSSLGVISGTPSVSGTFNFTVTATDEHSQTGSQAYSITIAPACGGYTVTGLDGNSYQTVLGEDGNCWFASNLGTTHVATAYNDSASYGDLYQWGRSRDGHQIATSGTTATLDTTYNQNNGGLFITNRTSPYDWLNPQNNNLWGDTNRTNNVCPAGWHVPSQTEWSAWATAAGVSSCASNCLQAMYNTNLKLPAAGYRNYGSGSLGNQNVYGYYWSSSVSGTNASNLFFSSVGVNSLTSSADRADGFSVRCVQGS